VNIYVESNFVLELALLQEQQTSCEEILRLSEAGKVHLVLPAYSIAEPYETLVRRYGQRKRMKAELDVELRQLSRTTTYAQRLSGFQNLTALLIDSADEEAKRLEEVRERLLKAGEIIPLEVLTLTHATQYQRAHGLSPQDAIVYAAVLSNLKQQGTAQSCFLNRNAKDFDDPDLVEELNAYNCKLLAQFDTGYQFIRSRLSQDTDPA
jgi:predicted nucleic acid-binding protein